ncbi:hypothetical protein XENTR_v10009315 [Xenopus tropicalis]|nr:hypothetical protein XENTR_v10009315 [Xenopus tropicalis]
MGIGKRSTKPKVQSAPLVFRVKEVLLHTHRFLQNYSKHFFFVSKGASEVIRSYTQQIPCRARLFTECYHSLSFTCYCAG